MGNFLFLAVMVGRRHECLMNRQPLAKFVCYNSGANTHTGNTTIANGTLVLSTTGTLTLHPTSNANPNKLTGPGTATIDGKLHLDLTSTALAHGNAWPLVDAATKSFGSTFTLTSTPALSFTESADIWTATDGGRI